MGEIRVIQKEKVAMKYDFTTIMNREGKDAIAVDVVPIPGAEVKEGFSKIPMSSLIEGDELISPP